MIDLWKDRLKNNIEIQTWLNQTHQEDLDENYAWSFEYFYIFVK
jgi:hypothetical protein